MSRVSDLILESNSPASNVGSLNGKNGKSRLNELGVVVRDFQRGYVVRLRRRGQLPEMLGKEFPRCVGIGLELCPPGYPGVIRTSMPCR